MAGGPVPTRHTVGVVRRPQQLVRSLQSALVCLGASGERLEKSMIRKKKEKVTKVAKLLEK